MAPKKLPKGKNTYFVFIVVSYRFSFTNLLKLIELILIININRKYWTTNTS